MPSSKRSGNETAIPTETVGLIPPLLQQEALEADSMILLSSQVRALPPGEEGPASDASKGPWWLALLSLILSRAAWGTYISLFVHLSLFILLATFVYQSQSGASGEPLDVGFSSEPGNLEIVELEGTDLEVEDSLDMITAAPLDTGMADAPVASLIPPAVPSVLPNPSLPQPNPSQPIETGQEESPGSRFSEALPMLSRSGTTKSRTSDARTLGLPGREGDTTDKSEKAVEAGLAWLARHQLPDGSWAFDLAEKDINGRPGECQGQCPNITATSTERAAVLKHLHPSRMVATAFAILPFLGAGYTHTGQEPGNIYQRNIAKGLEYLKYNAISTANGTDFRSGLIRHGMYIQGIVTLALCEAFEMTHDETLKPYAQGGLDFIAWAQREDGGWRYHTPADTDFIKDITGDISVSGWQMMALKSGISAGLDVRPNTIYSVQNFLNLVQSQDGDLYHYTPLRNETSVDDMWGRTAAGLLMRQYLGWQADSPGMQKGLEHLIEWINLSDKDWQKIRKNVYIDGNRPLVFDLGEDNGLLVRHNIYFTYNAALVLNNFGGSDWHRSFKKIRDFLIETQWGQGHASGSWLFYDRYMNDGGRLLNTAMSILILETPYRYLPMYQVE
ncbi:MAG: terpene cyclase/mutase family protein [Planctomycetia bacterium]|nr:terpene cyclase/mutase family protein [Planctomycetia bacterium]